MGILLVVRRQEMNDILLEALLILLVTLIEKDCEPARGTRSPGHADIGDRPTPSI